MYKREKKISILFWIQSWDNDVKTKYTFKLGYLSDLSI